MRFYRANLSRAIRERESGQYSGHLISGEEVYIFPERSRDRRSAIGINVNLVLRVEHEDTTQKIVGRYGQ